MGSSATLAQDAPSSDPSSAPGCTPTGESSGTGEPRSRLGRIPEGANELTSGYLEQRLTPEGVELVRSEVAGLFDRSRTLLETVPADDDPWWGPDGRLALFVPSDYCSGSGVSGSTRRRPARPPPVASITENDHSI